MRRLLIMVSTMIFAMILLCGCSSRPSDAETQNVAIQYLSKEIPDIKASDIKVIEARKTGGGFVMVIQVGKSDYNLIVVKGKDGWVGKGLTSIRQSDHGFTSR